MRTIIINYLDMSNLGGIEKYIYKLAIVARENKIRFIWFHEEPMQICDSFKGVLLSDSVERIKVWSRDFHWFKHEKVVFGENEKVLVLSFDPVGMARSEKFILQNKGCDITPLYMVPDVTGKGYFLERFFSGWTNSYVKNKMKKIVQKWENDDLVRFFNPTQITALENNYGIEISNKQDKLLKPMENPPKINEDELCLRAKRLPFSIITVSRFDFPHKGYLIGLVKAFGRVKEQYPDIKLKIIGYGPGKELLLQEIEKLPTSFQKDILLVGEVSPLELKEHFVDASLNIGVSGAVLDGAKNCVLSAMARNWYTEECEVYGLLNADNRYMTTASSPGYLVDKLICDVIQMSEEEYKKQSRVSYSVCRQDAEPLYILHTRTTDRSISVNRKDVDFLRFISYLSKFAARLN